MKKLLLAVIIALLGCSPSTTVKNPGSPGPKKTTTDKPKPKEEKKKTIDWQPFNDDLVKVSVALDKTVFVYIKDETCNVCEAMDKTTFSDQIVVGFINRKLIPTAIDINKEPKAASIFYDSREVTVPKFVFIRPQESGRWVVVEATGYRNSFQIIALIQEAEEFIKKHLDEKPDEESPGEHQGVPAE